MSRQEPPLSQTLIRFYFTLAGTISRRGNTLSISFLLICNLQGCLLRHSGRMSTQFIYSLQSLMPRRSFTCGMAFRRQSIRFTVLPVLSRVGLSAKLFAKITRFQMALDAKLRRPDRLWISIARGFGYHDQMHMLHDFQHLGGATPSCLSFQIGDCRPPALVTSDWSSSGDRWWCNSQSYGLSVNCSENLLRCEQSGRNKEPLSWQILRRDDRCPSRHW